jgi:uncharacterized membrane protein
MKVSWKTEWPPLVLLALMFLFAAMQWNQVPERVPVHWGLDGQPNGWGPRGLGLFGLPVTALFAYVVLTVVPSFDPGRANWDTFAGAYRTLRIALLVFLFVLQAAMIESFHGVHVDMNRVILPLMGVLFVVIGGVMGKLRPNWTAGIRTPWTLSSKLSWTRTHQLGGRAFIANGLVWIAMGFTGGRMSALVPLGITTVVVIGLVAYSYVVWKNDPDKTPPAGTSPGGD